MKADCGEDAIETRHAASQSAEYLVLPEGVGKDTLGMGPVFQVSTRRIHRKSRFGIANRRKSRSFSSASRRKVPIWHLTRDETTHRRAIRGGRQEGQPALDF